MIAPLAWPAPRVLALVCDDSGCVAWRVIQPFAELQRQGAPVGAVEWHAAPGAVVPPAVANLVPRFDALLLPRFAFTSPEMRKRWMAPLKRLGTKLWYECDDDLFTPHFVRFLHGRGGLRRGTPVGQLERERQARLDTLQACDGVTVSTPRLATVVRTLTDAPVAVIPNALDLRWFRRSLAVAPPPPRDRPRVTIGWAGGRRPDRELVTMARAWARVAARHPDPEEVGFVVAGYQPPPVLRLVPRARLRTVPWRPVGEYPWSLVGIDVACCPLEELPFSRTKSPIKAWEAAAAGSAVVASPTVYRHAITDGEDGLLCEGVDAWEAALERLIADEPLRRHLAAAQLARVERDHDLAENAWRWPAAWAWLMEQSAAGRAA